MFCPFCGKESAPGAKFCTECGKRLPEEAKQSSDLSQVTPPRKISLASRSFF